MSVSLVTSLGSVGPQGSPLAPITNLQVVRGEAGGWGNQAHERMQARCGKGAGLGPCGTCLPCTCQPESAAPVQAALVHPRWHAATHGSFVVM